MKATALPRRALALSGALLAILLAGCVPAPHTAPQGEPAMPRQHATVRVPPPPPADWRDMPITPGTWVWSGAGGGSVARFADGALVLRCERARGIVTLLRAKVGAETGAATAPVALAITTSTAARALPATQVTGPPAAALAELPANDRLLDAMAFSRGRFVVAVAGLPTLYVPSWPEVARVVQDCR